jgi:hypothetical protein
MASRLPEAGLEVLLAVFAAHRRRGPVAGRARQLGGRLVCRQLGGGRSKNNNNKLTEKM